MAALELNSFSKASTHGIKTSVCVCSLFHLSTPALYSSGICTPDLKCLVWDHKDHEGIKVKEVPDKCCKS